MKIVSELFVILAPKNKNNWRRNNEQWDTKWRTTRRYNQSDATKDQSEKMGADRLDDQNNEVKSRMVCNIYSEWSR